MRFDIPPHKIEAWVIAHFEYKRRADTELIIVNPFINDGKFKFNISTEKGGRCHDWRGDDWAGPINPTTKKRNCSFINFVRLYKKCSYYDAMKEVLGTASFNLFKFLPKTQDSIIVSDEYSIPLPNNVKPLSDATDKQAMILKKWVKSRGYTDDTIKSQNLHYNGMDVYWLYYEFDELVYWQSRSRLNKQFNFPDAKIYDDKGNIIGKAEYSKGDYFYGFDDINTVYVIITESIFAKNTLGLSALASGGADLTSTQINKLRLLGSIKKIILSPDNDAAGISSIIRNFERLSSRNYSIYYSIPPKLPYYVDGKKCFSKDWNELFEYCKFPLSDILQIHNNNIKQMSMIESLKLKELIR